VNPFRYERADDVPGAVSTVACAPGAAYLAGGTNLVDLMKLGVATPEVLVDVRRLTSDRVERGMRGQRSLVREGPHAGPPRAPSRMAATMFG